VTDSSGITNSYPGCGRPHNAHRTAKINKVKDLALIFWSMSLPQSILHLRSKTSWASVFLCIFSLTSI